MNAAANGTFVECRYFYTSRLSAGQPVTVVADILRGARAFNHQAAIGGALLFDGENFAQLLEGPAAAVQALARRIEADRRHHAIVVHLEEVGQLPRVFDGWLCGWCDSDDLRPILSGDLPPLGRLEHFQALVASSEAA